MKRPNRFVIVCLLFTLFIPNAGPVFAVSENPFDPNFLISDEEMQYSESMDVPDIQAFIEEQGGYIATYMSKDWEGIERTAATIIQRAAEEYRINPRYLLVTLQKEQSLITDPDPTQKQLDWATGYGVCDACKMTDP